MSDRLQGLGGRGGRKFAPNVVSRRSKEDREATAPAIKPENAEPKVKQEPNRRPAGRRGNIISLPAPQPLPAASRSGRGGHAGGFGGPSDRSTAAGQTPAYKQEYTGSDTTGSSGHTFGKRIDVSDPQSAAGFFPIQVPRREALADPEGLPTEVAHEVLDSEATAHILETQPPKIQLDPDQLYLVSLSSLELPPAGQEAADDEDAMDIDGGKTSQSYPEGLLGSLRYHASGKVSVKIGDKVLDLAPGAGSSSTEEVIVLNEQESTASLLGAVQSRLVLLPRMAPVASSWQGQWVPGALTKS